MKVFSKICCFTGADGCQKFVQYIRMFCPGRFILVDSVSKNPWPLISIENCDLSIFKHSLKTHCTRNSWPLWKKKAEKGSERRVKDRFICRHSSPKWPKYEKNCHIFWKGYTLQLGNFFSYFGHFGEPCRVEDDEVVQRCGLWTSLKSFFWTDFFMQNKSNLLAVVRLKKYLIKSYFQLCLCLDASDVWYLKISSMIFLLPRLLVYYLADYFDT